MPDNESIDQLRERLESLERLVAALQGQRGNFLHPFGTVFLARAATGDDADDAPSDGFVEQTVNDGQVEDYPDGRKCVTPGDSSALVDPGGAFAVIEVPDVDGDGNLVMRNVPIQSSSVKLVHVTGQCTGGGLYPGKMVTGSAKPTSATWFNSNLAMPMEGMSEPQDEDCYVANLTEDGESTHVLTDGSSRAVTKPYYFCLQDGVAPDGKPIFFTLAHAAYTCAVV